MPAMTPTPEFQPLAEADLDALEALLDRLPATLQPMDVVMIDGYLCGVLLQPKPVPEASWITRIVDAAEQTLAQAGLPNERVDALYFTGGSTGFKPLADRIAARFPAALVKRGDRFASVAQGLGVHARRVFG